MRRIGRYAQRAPQKPPHPRPGSVADGGINERGQAQFHTQNVRGRRQLGRRVDEGAVEVKKNSVNSRHHCGFPGVKCNAFRRLEAERLGAGAIGGSRTALAFSCASSSAFLSQRSFNSCCSTATMA